MPAGEPRLENQEFTDENRKRWRPRDRDAADDERGGGERRRTNKPVLIPRQNQISMSTPVTYMVNPLRFILSLSFSKSPGSNASAYTKT